MKSVSSHCIYFDNKRDGCPSAFLDEAWGRLKVSEDIFSNLVRKSVYISTRTRSSSY